MKPKPVHSVPVSKLKAELLEFVRKVEQGHTIEVTKDGVPVARLVPIRAEVPLFGFADVRILGPLNYDSTDDWEVLKAAESDEPMKYYSRAVKIEKQKRKK